MAKSINRKLAELIEGDGTTDLGGGGNGGGTTYYDTLDSLPVTELTAGSTAFVEENRRLYVSDGNGWYNASLVNRGPRWDSGGEPDPSYSIADSATPLIITARAIDSDNVNFINQADASDSAQYMVDISIDSSVFTFTPKSADSIGASVASGDLTDSNGDFIYTFKWSDGINFVSKAVTITYAPGGFAGYAFTTHTFTNAGATGRDGPSQAQLDSAYGDASWYNTLNFSSSNGIQKWKVPATATYRITADGAYGGVDTEAGSPARIQGDVDLQVGEELYILVGQRGQPAIDDGGAGGGGGGTFVIKGQGTNNPLIIAGGGGGADGGPTGGDASTTTTANADGDGIGSGSGSSGGGAVNGGASGGGGGAGLTGDGADGNGGGGSSYSNGGRGGSAGTGQDAHVGGFGGGGGSAGASDGGGGGGGYTGGKGGDGAGTTPDTAGGGSYTATSVTNVTSSILAGYGNPSAGNADGAPDAGKVVITKL